MPPRKAENPRNTMRDTWESHFCGLCFAILVRITLTHIRLCSFADLSQKTQSHARHHHDHADSCAEFSGAEKATPIPEGALIGWSPSKSELQFDSGNGLNKRIAQQRYFAAKKKDLALVSPNCRLQNSRTEVSERGIEDNL